MATGELILPAGLWTPSDGSSGNAAPAGIVTAGTQTNPKSYDREWAFDASTIEYLTSQALIVPVDYSSGGTLLVKWRTTGTSNNCIWAARVSCVTPADADTPLEHAFSTEATVTTAANTTEASRLITSSITLNMDSAAAGDEMRFLFYRKASDASDTLTVDAIMRVCHFQYTTA